VDSQPERLTVRLLATKKVIASVMEGPQNSTVDFELTKDSRLKGSSFPLQEVSICYSTP
jgi:hypothetical protein